LGTRKASDRKATWTKKSELPARPDSPTVPDILVCFDAAG
jgi:hypothetical protein